MRKKRVKRYYACHILETNELIISTMRAPIARKLGLHNITLGRHLSKSDVWISDEFVLWKGVEIVKFNTGFAYRR